MTALLWGIPGDPTMTLVRRALSQLGVPFLFLDQRQVLAMTVELSVGPTVEGMLRVDGAELDLRWSNGPFNLSASYAYTDARVHASGAAAALDGKRLMVGCVDLSDPQVESVQTIVERIERALPYVKPENVILAPDCGMKYLPRETAIGKLAAMVEAAKILRQRHG